MLDPAELIDHLEKMRAILDAFRREINATIELAAQLPSPMAREKLRCPHCGIFTTYQARMDEHLYNVHGIARELERESSEVADVNGLTTLAQGNGADE